MELIYQVSDFFAKHFIALGVLAVLISPPIRRLIRRFIYNRLGLKKRWKKLLLEEVPHYFRLPDNLRKKLELSTNIFLREMRFKGRNGFKLTDREKVIIAAHACILLLGWRKQAYNGLREVSIYPSTIETKNEKDIRRHKSRLPKFIAGLWSEDGTIRLCWDSVAYGGMMPFDGHNVVFHEFAHEIDYLYGFSGGMCNNNRSFMERIRGWLYQRELKKLRRSADEIDPVISQYGTTNQSELFACATEAFFERPDDLKEKHPAIYKRLQKTYRLDPASWQSET